MLTHDPGMYPKRLILDDARNLGITVLPLDVNASDATYRVERLPAPDSPSGLGDPPHLLPNPDLPDGRPYGIRLSLADVKGISDAEVARIVAGRRYRSLADFWHRAQVARPVVERLIVAGGFDSLYGLTTTLPVRRRDRVTRRDLLLQVAELERWTRATTRSRPGRPRRTTGPTTAPTEPIPGHALPAEPTPGRTAAEAAPPAGPLGDQGGGAEDPWAIGVRAAAARQSRAPRATAAPDAVQLALDLGDAPDETVPSGLPEMTGADRVRAELEVLGLDVSRHVLDFYAPLLSALGVTRSREVLSRRNQADLLVAGVKVATQTPPVRSGRRVVFLTLDDATGPVDATFFEDVQGPYAATVFHSWLLVVRGVLRRTGPRGVSLRATGAWELPVLWDAWVDGGLDAVHDILSGADQVDSQDVLTGAAASRSTRPVMVRPPVAAFDGGLASEPGDWEAATGLPTGDRAGGMGGGTRHRVLVHPTTGYRQSPYADLKPPGEDTRDTRRMLAAEQADRADRPGSEPPRKLWHASPGSSGR